MIEKHPMTPVDLASVMSARKLNQSDLARLAGVSRQAVSLWMRQPMQTPVEMRASHLLNLSRRTGISLDVLTAPWPLVGTPEEDALSVELLWDRLYPGLVDFAVALAGNEEKAIARLVQVYGLYRAAVIVGEEAWKGFPRYQRYIQPQRREGLERVWRFETSRT